MSIITKAGIQTRTYEEIVASLEARFKGAFGDAFDTTAESPDGQNIRIMAKHIYDQEQLAESVYHGYNPAVAKDNALDNLVRLNGLRRIQNSPTQVSLWFDATDSAGLEIPAGGIVKTQTGDLEFKLLYPVIVPGEALAECTRIGAYVIAPEEVTELQGDYPEDITVTNPEAGVTGIIRETNEQLRARRDRAVAKSGTNTAEALYAAMADMNLQFLTVLANRKNVEVDGIPPHGVMVVAEGSTIPLIAERVFQNIPIGTTAYGDYVITITDSCGVEHEIGVSRPRETIIHIKCQVVRPRNVAVNRLVEIQDALISHINSLQIASTVEWAKLFAPATTAAPDVNIKNITLSRDGASWAAADIPMGPIEKPRTYAAYVEIEELDI